jgi:hypothetical protein
MAKAMKKLDLKVEKKPVKKVASRKTKGSGTGNYDAQPGVGQQTS